MTKLISILSGRCLVVELPEGATNPEVHTRSLIFDTPMEVDEWGYDYQSVKLPEGSWKIVGMLSDVNWYESDIEALESAILAEGYYLDENPFGKAPGCGCTGPSDKGACDGCDDWMGADGRVLSRERCLLLRRVDL